MKVLLLITGLFPGGAEKIVLETARRLLENGQRAVVVSLQREPSGADRTIVDALRELGVRLYFLGLSPRRPWRLLTLRRIIRAEAPDVVHSHLIHANLSARFVRMTCKFPLVNTIHIAERRRSRTVDFLFRLDRLTFPLCDVCTAVSAAAARFHEKRCGLPENSVRVVYNGSDPVPPKPKEELARIRNEWGLAETSRLIGSAGRLDWQKGYDIFLERLDSLVPLIPAGERWGIVLIGDGPERDRLSRLAAEKEAQFPALKIVLPGYRPDAAALLPMLDLFVMPSRYEGFGLTFTEALAQGVPILCSCADSLPELCAMAPENTLAADFSDAGLTDIYRRALALPRLPGRVLFTTAGMAEEYMKIYRSLLDPRSAG